MVAAVFRGKGVEWISAGDSALSLRRGSGLVKLTRSHTVAAQLEAMVAKGQLSPEAARRDPDLDALTSYIGAGGIPEIDASQTPISLTVGDCVLLCSDGLYRVLDAQEIGAALDEAQTGQDASDLLVERVLPPAMRRTTINSFDRKWLPRNTPFR